MLTTIPFDGFYESVHSQIIDSEIESYFQYNDQGDSNVPWQESPDYNAIHEGYAKRYASEFNDALDVDLNLTFESLSSPREYNFTTDRIFCTIALEKAQILFDLHKSENFERLEKYIKEHFTSCDGFASSYSNQLKDWLEKPLDQWDHNEIGALIASMSNNIDQYELMESAMCNGFIYSLICDAMPQELRDFANVQSMARQEVDFSAWQNNRAYDDYVQQAYDADASVLSLDDWINRPSDFKPPYRCNKTKDMFK